MSLAVPGHVRGKNTRKFTTTIAPEQQALQGRIQIEHESLVEQVQGKENGGNTQAGDGDASAPTKVPITRTPSNISHVSHSSKISATESQKSGGASKASEDLARELAVEERLKEFAAPILQVAPDPNADDDANQKKNEIEILSPIEAFSGCYALVEEEDSLIINTLPLWETLWMRCLCAAHPCIDFNTHTAAAVFLGRKEEYGWGVRWFPARKWQTDTLVEFEVVEPRPLLVTRGEGDNAVEEEVQFTQFSQPYFIRVFELFPGTKQGLLRQRFANQEQVLERGGSAAVTSATARAKYQLLSDSDDD